MDVNKLFLRLRNEGRSFFEAAGKANELFYIVLLSLYVGLFYLLKIQWEAKAVDVFNTIRYTALGIIMWGSALYLLYVIAEWKNLWKKTIPLLLIAGVVLGGVYLFTQRMSTNLYGVVMDVFFCLLAYKKDFRKILKSLLGVSVGMLPIAGIGIVAGFTVDVGKPETDLPGHGLGINYPNTWGYLAFFALIVFWYLYLRFKPALTFPIFWATSLFMNYYIRCRTIAGLTLIFPIAGLAIDSLEKRMDRKAGEGTFKRIKPLEWIVTLIPLLAWAFMMINSIAVDWWYKLYHGPLRTLAWRFLMGGLYFKTYGIPLIGNPYRSNHYTYINVQGEFIKVGILDSSFAAYIIMRGIIWLFYTLLWLCVAHYKALKKRDYAIILIETFFLGFAMLERPGLEMWYNFILLYPLTKVIDKPFTEKVLDFEGVATSVIDSAKAKQVRGYVRDYKSFMKLDFFPGYHFEKYMSNADDTEDGALLPAKTRYDLEKREQYLQVPENWNSEKYLFYHELTNILDNQKFVGNDQEAYQCSRGFIEYHASQVQMFGMLGFANIDDTPEVSLGQTMNNGQTAAEYMQEKYKVAQELFENPEFSENEGIFTAGIAAFYSFLGARSVCEMYAKDYDAAAYDYTVFEEKLGTEIFNRIVNHMHGRADKVLFNICKGDYKELKSILGIDDGTL